MPKSPNYERDRPASPTWIEKHASLSGSSVLIPDGEPSINTENDLSASLTMSQLSASGAGTGELSKLLREQMSEGLDPSVNNSVKVSPVRFDGKTKSKFYNSLLRATGDDSSPGKLSPIRGPGSPKKQSQLRDALTFAATNDSNVYANMDSPDRIASMVAEDRGDDDSGSVGSGVNWRGRGGTNMSRSAPTPILLPDIKSLSSKGNITKGIKLNIKTLSKEQLKAKDTTFMNSTFQDGNANISQRNRHKYDMTGRNAMKGRDLEASSSSESLLDGEEVPGDSSGWGNSVSATKRPRRLKNFSSDQSVGSTDTGMASNSALEGDPMLGPGLGKGRPGVTYDIGPEDNFSRDISSDSYARRQRSAMADMTKSLGHEFGHAAKELSDTRNSLLSDADHMVSKLPMKYLWSKKNLRPYALARIYSAISKMTIYKIHVALWRAWSIWKDPPEVKMTENQVGFMVIAKRFENMWRNALRRKFDKWAFWYSPRFQEKREAYPDIAAREIQVWWRDIRVTSKDPFKWLFSAVQVCLQRRRAIKHMIEFELARRNAQPKMFRAIFARRRKYYAARSIIRPYIWMKLYRRVQMRLTRLANVRIIQRFYRMRLARSEKENRWIKAILRYGGYSKVLPKMPPRFVRAGFLQSLDMVAGVIQRAWYTSKGNYAAFIVAAARRAKEEHMQMLNDNATIIQHNFRGHLWNLLNLAAIQHNRARRISFAFRHYQYRVWAKRMLIQPPHRAARVIQRNVRRWIAHNFLDYRFRARKAFMLVFRRRQLDGAMAIQREYRAYKERERIRREAFIALVKMQRQQADLVMKNIKKIQLAWRKHLVVNRFPRHIYLVAWRYERARRRELYEKAVIIQKVARPHILRVIERRKARLMAAVQLIWRFSKSYLVKLAIWDRIMATREIQKAAAIVIQRFYRKIMFRVVIEFRRRVRVMQKKYKVFINNAATKVQRWIKRKWIEYFLPLRVTARAHVAANRVKENERCKENRRQHAALFITRFFRPWAGRWVVKSGDQELDTWDGKSHGWMRRTLTRIEKERRYYTERKAAKKMQKFCKKVVAWARFDKIAAYRKAAILEHSRLPAMKNAANVIGTYWYRKLEKIALEDRFKKRRIVLDEYARLEKLKIEAYEARDDALEKKRITDENLTATINRSWKQGSDIGGRNYFYNYVTGETTWEAPEHWKAPVEDTWIRQKDDRNNIYYYNMLTGESSWLPPCVVCGDQADRYCGNCQVAYCEKHYDDLHGEDAEDEDYKTHVWALTEYEKEELKRGEVYCLECKKKAAAVTCLECWDSYCKECFKYTHASGHLKYHKTANFHKAKKGWMCVKATSVDDADYYVNGQTGVTTYEKPLELMTVDERMYFDQFVSHRDQMQEFIEKISSLQHELEDTSYERDLIFKRALEQGTQMADVLARRKAKKKATESLFSAKDDGKDSITEVAKKVDAGFLSGISSAMAEYKKSLLAPQSRRRGAEKSDYIKELIHKVEADKEKK